MADKKDSKTEIQDVVLVASNFPHSQVFSIKDNAGIVHNVVIKGNAENLRGAKAQPLPVGAYGLTRVKTELWEAIKTQYAKHPHIKNGLVFATKYNNNYEASEETAERKDVRNGLEPINVDGKETNPTRMTRTEKHEEKVQNN